MLFGVIVALGSETDAAGSLRALARELAVRRRVTGIASSVSGFLFPVRSSILSTVTLSRTTTIPSTTQARPGLEGT